MLSILARAVSGEARDTGVDVAVIMSYAYTVISYNKL